MLELEEWVLLLVDGHNSRDFMPSIIVFEIHRVIVLVLPAHSATVLQPLDLQPNTQFKRVLTTHFKVIKVSQRKSNAFSFSISLWKLFRWLYLPFISRLDFQKQEFGHFLLRPLSNPA
jgi:hypothetical protein